MAATKAVTARQAPIETAPPAPSRPAPGFDWVVAILSCWLVGGVFVDGWAHNHMASLETFFTPWHAVLYSGFAAVATPLAFAWLRGVRIERPLWRSVPT